MFNKNIIRSCELLAGECRGTINYYLLTKASESLLANEAVNGVTYGIEIELINCRGDGPLKDETDAVGAFIYIKEEALKLINKMADSQTTPMDLVYIIDDFESLELMGEYSYNVAN